MKAATVGPCSGQREVSRRAPPAPGLAGDPGLSSPEAADGEHSFGDGLREHMCIPWGARPIHQQYLVLVPSAKGISILYLLSGQSSFPAAVS